VYTPFVFVTGFASQEQTQPKILAQAKPAPISGAYTYRFGQVD